jgi:hypothetical protein
VQEITIDYSHCWDQAPDVQGPMPSNLITSHFAKNEATENLAGPTWSKSIVTAEYTNTTTGVVHATVPDTTRCTIQFQIPHEMETPVLFYYRLTNFYQNHRRYAKSFNTDQLSGKAVSASSVHGSDCTPLTTETVNGTEKLYYPCGLAANSIFNDTFYNPVLLNVPDQPNGNQTYNMTSNKDIAWASDRELYGQSSYKWSDVAVPRNWILRYPDGFSDEYHPDLQNDQAFQVWMRLAGLPTFSKLALRNDNENMGVGRYSVDIDHRTS